MIRINLLPERPEAEILRNLRKHYGYSDSACPLPSCCGQNWRFIQNSLNPEALRLCVRRVFFFGPGSSFVNPRT
jgi:hypothetical protein